MIDKIKMAKILPGRAGRRARRQEVGDRLLTRAAQ